MKKSFVVPGLHKMEQEKIQVITKRFRTKEVSSKSAVIMAMAGNTFIEKLIRSNSTPLSCSQHTVLFICSMMKYIEGCVNKFQPIFSVIFIKNVPLQILGFVLKYFSDT